MSDSGHARAGGGRLPGVCAVVVAYHPPPGIADHVRAILEQCDAAVVVDNTPGGSLPGPLAALASWDRTTVVRMGGNEGIGAALNRGVSHARAAGYEWVALFDQDSTPAPGMVRALQEAAASLPPGVEPGVVAPAHQDLASGIVHGHPATNGSPPVPVDTAITSGQLVPIAALEGIGGFREDLFLDYVDIEFCLRCHAHGRAVLSVPGALLHHRLGVSVARRWMGREVGVTNHPPFRRYYISRNRVHVYREYWRRRPGWVARDLHQWLREIVKIVLWERTRWSSLRAMARGVADGVRKRYGPLPEGS